MPVTRAEVVARLRAALPKRERPAVRCPSCDAVVPPAVDPCITCLSCRAALVVIRVADRDYAFLRSRLFTGPRLTRELNRLASLREGR
jgi:hypothetical protein